MCALPGNIISLKESNFQNMLDALPRNNVNPYDYTIIPSNATKTPMKRLESVQIPSAVFQCSHTVPVPWGQWGSLQCISQEGHGDRIMSAGLSELQQSLHAAGVLLYAHGGSVSGAGQHVQNFILSFQLRLCLQGEALQLHQHLF